MSCVTIYSVIRHERIAAHVPSKDLLVGGYILVLPYIEPIIEAYIV